jgi:hypothetical protein
MLTRSILSHGKKTTRFLPPRPSGEAETQHRKDIIEELLIKTADELGIELQGLGMFNLRFALEEFEAYGKEGMAQRRATPKVAVGGA